MRRCATDRRVYFVEPPVVDAGPARVEWSGAPGGVVVVTLRLPDGAPHDGIASALLAAEFAARSVDRPIVWFASASAFPLAGGVEASTIVFDVDDFESDADRARVLLVIADLVFAASAEVYDAVRAHHPRAMPFASPVDAEGWDVLWVEMAACIGAHADRRRTSRRPSSRDTLDDAECGEETQPVVGVPT